MAQRESDKYLNELVRVAGEILKANGYQIVAQANLPLAATKNDRMLICTAKTYAETGQFLNPDEMNQIRDDLNSLAVTAGPGGAAGRIDKVALVLVPGDITVASSEGDIKWVVVEDVEELPEEMDKVLGWS